MLVRIPIFFVRKGVVIGLDYRVYAIGSLVLSMAPTSLHSYTSI